MWIRRPFALHVAKSRPKAMLSTPQPMRRIQTLFRSTTADHGRRIGERQGPSSDATVSRQGLSIQVHKPCDQLDAKPPSSSTISSVFQVNCRC